MSARLYLIRHGEADMPDAEGRIHNYSDAPLTERGRDQARRMAAVLAGVEVDAVASSDIPRAIETAEILSGGRHEVLIDPRLREVDLGEYDGMSMALVARVDPRYLPWPGVAFHGRVARTGYHIPAELPFPGGESARTMADRLVPGFADLAAAWQGATVAVVSHGWAIQALLCHVVGAAIRDYFRFSYANASTTLVEVDAAGHGSLLLHNADLDLARPTAGRLRGPAPAGDPDRGPTCRVLTVRAGPAGAALAAELEGVEAAAVLTAPDPESRRLADAVAAATGTTPRVDPRLDGAGAQGAAGCLVEAASTALGSAVVLVAGAAASSRIAVHVIDGEPAAAARLPALPGGLDLAEVEADGRGVLHIWNGRSGYR